MKKKLILSTFVLACFVNVTAQTEDKKNGNENDNSEAAFTFTESQLGEDDDMSQNVTLREGDILYLTKNHRIDFARDIAPIFSSIYMITEAKDNLDNN